MSPTILYDGLNLSLGKGTGIATYARALIESARGAGYRAGVAYALPGRVPANVDLSKTIMVGRGGPAQGRAGHALDWARARLWLFGRLRLSRPSRFDLKPAEGGADPPLPACDEVRFGQAIFRRGRLHFEAKGTLAELVTEPRPDLAHFTAPLPVRVRGTLNVYTVHDLVPLRFPNAIGGSRETFLRVHREIARTADHIVTVSEASRRDIVELLGVSPDRVTNTYQSVFIPGRLQRRSADQVTRDVGAFGLEPGRYFLFYGAIEPKKNVKRLLDAFLSSGLDLPFVVVSSSGWDNASETAILSDPAFRDKDWTVRRGPRLKPLSYVDRDALVSLIKGARAVTFPSLYEGFGLPVLEAMLLGTPVLTSNAASLPEVAGDAALLVNPTDVDAIRRGLVALASDDDLCRELSRRGLARAELFSPERYRERVVALYTKLGISPPKTGTPTPARSV